MRIEDSSGELGTIEFTVAADWGRLKTMAGFETGGGDPELT